MAPWLSSVVRFITRKLKDVIVVDDPTAEWGKDYELYVKREARGVEISTLDTSIDLSKITIKQGRYCKRYCVPTFNAKLTQIHQTGFQINIESLTSVCPATGRH